MSYFRVRAQQVSGVSGTWADVLSRFHLGHVWVLGCSVVSASFQPHVLQPRASHMVLVENNPPANAEDIKDTSLIPEWGRSPGGGHGNPLKYSCLENPMDSGAWQATVQRVPKSRTRLSDKHFHFQSVYNSSKVVFCRGLSY